MTLEQEVRFTGGDRDMDGYLALPEDQGTFPAVIVIQEIWGLVDHIRDVARRFANEGYVALTPDLYTGEWREVMSPERIAAGMAFLRNAPQEVQRDPSKLESALSERPQEERDAIKMLATVMSSNQRFRFAEDLLGAVEYLKSRPEVDGDRIGSIGFCMGGAISGYLATLSPDLRAAVIFYGQNPPLERVPDIQARVLGIYGGEDHRITDTVPELEEAMERARALSTISTPAPRTPSSTKPAITTARRLQKMRGGACLHSSANRWEGPKTHYHPLYGCVTGSSDILSVYLWVAA